MPETVPAIGVMCVSFKWVILAWLAFIGENDIVTLGEVIEACRRDADARAYFLGRASERLVGDGKANC
jgi:hypothetical protein